MTAENPERRDRASARKTILATVDDADQPLHIADVVATALQEHDATSVFEAFSALIRNGELYEPTPNYIRRPHAT